MNICFGDASVFSAPKTDSTRIQFCANGLELKWKHCSSYADFLSRYYSGVLRARADEGQVKDLTYSISYLANELIENAVKFRAEGLLELEAALSENNFTLKITNPISAKASARFQLLLQEITVGDPGDLLIERIEANALDDQASGSGLGLLTLMNDYGARFVWRFNQPEDQPEADVLLETICQLSLPPK